MKHLYFMRHGLSEMNKLGLFSGRSDTELAPEGVKQCHQAAASLKDVNIDTIVSSPMKRALESAKVIAEEIDYPKDKIVVSDLFMERDLGTLEGSKYIRGLKLNEYDGTEHSRLLIERAKKGLLFLESLKGENILLVSHSSLGRALRHLTDPDTEFDRAEGFQNAEIVKLI